MTADESSATSIELVRTIVLKLEFFLNYWSINMKGDVIIFATIGPGTPAFQVLLRPRLHAVELFVKSGTGMEGYVVLFRPIVLVPYRKDFCMLSVVHYMH